MTERRTAHIIDDRPRSARGEIIVDAYARAKDADMVGMNGLPRGDSDSFTDAEIVIANRIGMPPKRDGNT
ncbi:MAG: hypothetical protein AAB573_02670 [Patescibacteria group bacterium]